MPDWMAVVIPGDKRRHFINMLNYFQILILALIQGACELLPVSSSAHVIAAEKLMKLDPSSPEMTMLLVMLHTGTMFAVIVYFWKGWKRDYFASSGTDCNGLRSRSSSRPFAPASWVTGLKVLIEKIFMRGMPHAEVEDLFANLPLIAGALAAVGVVDYLCRLARGKIAAPFGNSAGAFACWIGIVQGICLPFRGFSRSGSTISTGLLLGLPKQKLEEFSFALAVVLTPLVIAKEALRLLRHHDLSGSGSALHLFIPGLVGMVFSFIAGLLALKWLSRWLEGGRWKFFGCYCLAAAAGVLALHFALPR